MVTVSREVATAEEIRVRVQRLIDQSDEVRNSGVRLLAPLPTMLGPDIKEVHGSNWIMGRVQNGTAHPEVVSRAIAAVQRRYSMKI